MTWRPLLCLAAAIVGAMGAAGWICALGYPLAGTGLALGTALLALAREAA